MNLETPEWRITHVKTSLRKRGTDVEHTSIGMASKYLADEALLSVPQGAGHFPDAGGPE